MFPAKSSYKIFTIIIALLLFTQIVPGQQDNLCFKHFGINEGLQSNTVYSITKDSKGLMWFATQSGLYRFDGRAMKCYRTDPNDSTSISGNILISDISEDKEKRLWIGSTNGLSVYNRFSDSFKRYHHKPDDPFSIANDNPHTFFCDRNGDYYDSLSPIILNNIFWNNIALSDTGKDIYHGGDKFLRIENNNVDTGEIVGNWEGSGNIFEDPEFIDGLYHIDSLSPCLNKGVDSLLVDGQWYHAPLHDLDGNPRPDTICFLFDLGAYERQDCFSQSVESLDQTAAEPNINVYPNPFITTTTVEFELSKPGNINITIYNRLGQIIESIDQGNIQQGKHQHIWNASGLPNGIYFVQVRAGQEVTTQKVVKMR